MARQHATDAEIIAGAHVWRNAEPNPRYLIKLCEWLDLHCWTKPPPEKPAKRSKSNKPNGQYRGGKKKFDAAGFALKYVGLTNRDGGAQ
jgi:hypothetical protein